jgi:hypothetical protein
LTGVETSALKIGQSYAYREKRGPKHPMLKVKLIDVVGRKGKVKVRFEDGPHPGLEEYVATRQIVVPWGQRKAVLRDEERSAQLAHYAATVADRVLGDAALSVLTATGEPGADVGAEGLSMDERELQRIIDRTGLDIAPVDLHHLAYRDRMGNVHAPLDAAVMLAQAFAAAEPQVVVQYLDDEEEENRIRGNRPGDRWWHDYQREQAPAFALARRWAGLEQEAELLKQEIARLRSLVSSAAYDLKAAGQDRKSQRLLRALDGRR